MFKYLFSVFLFGASLAFGMIDKKDSLEEQHAQIEKILLENDPDCHFSSTVLFYQSKVPSLLINYSKQHELLAKEGDNNKRESIQEKINAIFLEINAFIADGEFILGHSMFNKDN
jgi:hypothetical protein